jgi:7SK snRNA methylphosphate capping enzyme
LDVGCNEGFVTCEVGELESLSFLRKLWCFDADALGQSLGADKVVGVDIDDTLVRAAWRRRRTVWSLQGPSDFSAEKQNKRRREPSPTILNSHAGHQADYFPASCEHMFGPLPIPPSANKEDHSFPHNVLFRTADWVQDEIPEDAEGYDVVIA